MYTVADPLSCGWSMEAMSEGVELGLGRVGWGLCVAPITYKSGSFIADPLCPTKLQGKEF